jgi:hypothetical protein
VSVWAIGQERTRVTDATGLELIARMGKGHTLAEVRRVLGSWCHDV